MTKEQMKLLKQVRMHAFAVVEANLYLDSHPDCKDGLEYYRKHNKAYEEAKAKYEKEYTPLTVNGAMNDDKWKWATDPWPWERGES